MKSWAPREVSWGAQPLWWSCRVMAPSQCQSGSNARRRVWRKTFHLASAQTATPVLLWLHKVLFIWQLPLRQHLASHRPMSWVCYNELTSLCCMYGIAIDLVCYIVWGEAFSTVLDPSEDSIWHEYPFKYKATATIKWFIQCPGIYCC